jgi:hypothetical protein
MKSHVAATIVAASIRKCEDFNLEDDEDNEKIIVLLVS